MKALSVCVVGAGRHAQQFHLPALRHYALQFPGRISLGGICDSDATRASAVAREYQANAYTDLQTMLTAEVPDSCLALTDVQANAQVAMELIGRGIAALIEKPLGSTLPIARQLTEAAENKPVMVSMNRRFDPLFSSARRWIADRDVRYFRITMVRHNRSERLFLEQTGLHVVDVAQMIGGTLKDWSVDSQEVGGSDWIQISLTFTTGTRGRIDILPTSGGNGEFIELFGAGFRVEVRPAEFDNNVWRAWEDGTLVREESLSSEIPQFIANGTYAETEAFIEKLSTREAMIPAPADILPSMELCFLVAEQVRKGERHSSK